MGFKKEVRESKVNVERRESWNAEIAGYDVIVHVDSGGRKRVSAYQRDTPGRAIRYGIVDFCPTHVDALDQLAEDAPTLLRGIAALLREEGVSDMRDEWEINHEKLMAKMAQGSRRA